MGSKLGGTRGASTSPRGTMGPPSGRRHRRPWRAAGSERAWATRVRAAAAISCEAHRHPAHKHTRVIKYKNKTSLKVPLWKEKEKKSTPKPNKSHLLQLSLMYCPLHFSARLSHGVLGKTGSEAEALGGGTASPQPFAGSSAESWLKH